MEHQDVQRLLEITDKRRFYLPAADYDAMRWAGTVTLPMNGNTWRFACKEYSRDLHLIRLEWVVLYIQEPPYGLHMSEMAISDACPFYIRPFTPLLDALESKGE